MKITKFMSVALVITTILTQVSYAGSGKYCAGIRGNGELAPVHWASMARIVENKGMPEVIAGGSSAAISLFLLDAISRNNNFSIDPTDKRKEQALLLKSVVPHVLYIFNEDAKAPKIMKMIGRITGFGDGGFMHKLKSVFKIAGDFPTFWSTMGEYGPLLNPEMTKGLKRNFSFYKGQIAEGVKVFGGFDAKNDKNIFYREGLVDFKFLGVLFGRFADFYAGYGAPKVNDNLKIFLNECRDVSFNKQWVEIVKAKPACESLLNTALDSYYEIPTVTRRAYRFGRKVPYNKKEKGVRIFPDRMIFEKVGSGIKAFPSTAIVIGDAVTRYKENLKKYEQTNAEGVGDFVLDFDTELKYGYWGNSSDLNQVHYNLKRMYPNDTKSNKFMPIEGGSWFEVLGTSPAEPGLSNIANIPDGRTLDPKKIINKRYFYKKWGFLPTLSAIGWFDEENPTQGVAPFREGILSAGGWSDLHPSLVLKAAGCDDVVYVTRQGGESVFGQQIFIRLTGYTDKIRFWKNIKATNRIGVTELTEEERESPWNKLYNLGNPDSSFNLSIREADAVYCTDWDRYYIFKNEVLPALADAYTAPVFLKDERRRSEYNFGIDSSGRSKDGFPGCISQI